MRGLVPLNKGLTSYTLKREGCGIVTHSENILFFLSSFFCFLPAMPIRPCKGSYMVQRGVLEGVYCLRWLQEISVLCVESHCHLFYCYIVELSAVSSHECSDLLHLTA